MRKRFMLIRTTNWQLSFLYEYRRFQNRNLWHTFQTLFARKLALLFIWKWIASTLSVIWLETNGNVSSLWGPFFLTAPFFSGSIFLRSRVQGGGLVFRWYCVIGKSRLRFLRSSHRCSNENAKSNCFLEYNWVLF